ncbi:hypothetical protein MACK_002632 [Theileria orientalis]|uniref:MIF4G domain-containing protein n=1 Tax=Theileria orientalis TaxID=68886 RepID=A0A976QTT1_THEOR|nr:hypothetical protein MACK_002632 [Theileria orientalis]
MTVSKTGSQETTGKSRTGSNSLNPDAPEFNPTTKTGGKLNADAPEFVPGQLPHYEPLMLNVSEIKGGYKNGHMSGYRLSQQDQFVPVWLAQSYPLPYHQLYPNGPYDYIPYDYTRQTQNYPIQRNVYPNAVHNDYPLNMPYNVVVQGKAKMSNKAAKTRSNNKDSASSKDGAKEKEAPINSARDSMSVATTKDTTRDPLTSVREPTPQPPKPLTWAERTKLSTTRQLQKQTVVTTLGAPVPSAAQVTTHVPAAKPTVPEPARDGPKEAKHLQSGPKPQVGGHRDQSEVPRRGSSSSGSHQNAGKVATKAASTSAEAAGKTEEKTEQISYAKVFKEAVRSTALKQASASAKEGVVEPPKHVSESKQAAKKHEPAPVEPANHQSSSTTAASSSSKQQIPSTFKEQQPSEEAQSAPESEAQPSASVTQPTQTTHTPPQPVAQLEAQEKSQPEAHTFHTEPHPDLTQEPEEKTESAPQKVEEERKEEPCTHDSPGEAAEVREESKDETKDYSVEAMLNYYLYLLYNKNMVEEIRERYKLPRIKFLTTSQTTTSKSSYKERERPEKTEKKDWRHKSYDKNFGNFRFNKEFTRSEPTQQIMASEGSWLMKQVKQKRDKEVQLRKKILGLLNKLTFEKFDVIYNQIIQCGIDTPEHAEMLVKFVFDKAVTQHHFIPMYVELCAKLSVDLFTIESSTQKQQGRGGEAQKQPAEKGDPDQVKQGPGPVTDARSKVDENVTEGTKASDVKLSSELVTESGSKLSIEGVVGDTSRTVDSTTTVDTVHHTESSLTSTEAMHTPTRKAEDTKEYEKLGSDSSSASVCEEATAEGASAQAEEEAADPMEPMEPMEPAQSAKEHAEAQTAEAQNVSGEVPESKSAKRSDFIRILLSCSQDSFEDNLKPLEIPSDLEGDDRFEYEQKYKHKMRGNMMFVGELFKQKLLAAKLLITCLDQVFMKREECILLYNDINMGNNHLEAMCTLLQTVGRSFDTSRWKLITDFEKRIQHLEELGKNEQISFRIRCLIKNVLDRRMEHWDKSIYQSQDQPCKLQEFRHKHSVTSFSVPPAMKEKGERQDQVEETWRTRNKKKPSTNSTNKGEKHRKEGNRSYSKESDQRSNKQAKQEGYEQGIRRKHSSDQEEMKRSVEQNSDQEMRRIDSRQNSSEDDMTVRRRGVRTRSKYTQAREYATMSDHSEEQSREEQSDENSDDQMETQQELSADDEKMMRTAKSIVNELVMSYDTEESTLRVEEMTVQKNKHKELYKALVVACMESCSKVNAEKQTEVVTKWIVDLAKEKKKVESLLEGVHEFVFGEDEVSMEMLVDDYPLLLNTLKQLLSKMKPECEEKEKFKQVESKI